MTDIVDRIKKKQDQIKTLEKERAHQEGQEKQLLKQLKDETGVDSVEDAEKKLDQLGKELIENEEDLKKLDEEMGRIISTATSGSGSESE